MIREQFLSFLSRLPWTLQLSSIYLWYFCWRLPYSEVILSGLLGMPPFRESLIVVYEKENGD